MNGGIIQIPSITNLLATTTAAGQPVFDAFLPIALIVMGIVLGGVIVGFLLGGMKRGAGKVVGSFGKRRGGKRRR